MRSTPFKSFMQRLLALPRCMACGAPGPAICPACQRHHEYALEVEQRRLLIERNEFDRGNLIGGM